MLSQGDHQPGLHSVILPQNQSLRGSTWDGVYMRWGLRVREVGTHPIPCLEAISNRSPLANENPAFSKGDLTQKQTTPKGGCMPSRRSNRKPTQGYFGGSLSYSVLSEVFPFFKKKKLSCLFLFYLLFSSVFLPCRFFAQTSWLPMFLGLSACFLCLFCFFFFSFFLFCPILICEVLFYLILLLSLRSVFVF